MFNSDKRHLDVVSLVVETHPRGVPRMFIRSAPTEERTFRISASVRRRVLLSALLTVQVTTRIERKLLKGMGALALQCQ